MTFADRRHLRPVSTASLRSWLAVAVVVGLGLAASGCAQSLSEFARNGDGTAASSYPASTAPTTLAPGDPGSVATRPAVMVDERTVAVTQSPARSAPTSAPMAIAPMASTPAPAATTPPAAEVATAAPLSDRATAVPRSDRAIAPSALNLNQVPAQPKSKLLTPDEKAKVIAELEALAKKQSAELDADKNAACAASDDLNPAQRVASATGAGGC